MTTPTVSIPGYIAGTWAIDPMHSDVSFSVRHMMVSKVRGRFGRFSGEIVTAPDPLGSTVTATIDMSSIETNQEQRDGHVRSADFFDVDAHPTMDYRSTGIRQDGEGFVLDGELTLKGVTRQLPLRLDVNGFGPDASGGTVAGFSAAGTLSRSDFGISFNAVMDGGGVVVGDEIAIALELEAVLQD